jgi:hypothetical protein
MTARGEGESDLLNILDAAHWTDVLGEAPRGSPLSNRHWSINLLITGEPFVLDPSGIDAEFGQCGAHGVHHCGRAADAVQLPGQVRYMALDELRINPPVGPRQSAVGRVTVYTTCSGGQSGMRLSKNARNGISGRALENNSMVLARGCLAARSPRMERNGVMPIPPAISTVGAFMSE